MTARYSNKFLSFAVSPGFIAGGLGYLAIWLIWFRIFVNDPLSLSAQTLRVAVGVYTLFVWLVLVRRSKYDARANLKWKLGAAVVTLVTFGVVQQPRMAIFLVVLASGCLIFAALIHARNEAP